MRKIIVVGSSGYIGSRFCSYVKDKLEVEAVPSRGNVWRYADFQRADSVLFAAGLAHQKQTEKNRSEYFQVNTDLALEVAKYAKASGVRQYIYLSSVSVYGKMIGVVKAGERPTLRKGDAYGESKLLAERGLQTLEDDTFRVLIIRPPMVYGLGCKGNFDKLQKIVKVVPLFPVVQNQRSMIYIDNLCEFILQGVNTGLCGMYIPQDANYVNTTDMARLIAHNCNITFRASRLLGIAVRFLLPFSNMAQKAFGTLIFQGTETSGMQYQVVEFDQAIARSVGSK